MANIKDRGEVRVFVGAKLHPIAVARLLRIQQHMRRNGIRKPSQARAIEYAAAYCQLALDQKVDPVQEVIGHMGEIR